MVPQSIITAHKVININMKAWCKMDVSVCIQLACSRRPRALEEAHCWNIQAKLYNEKFPLVYENDKTRDSLSWRLWCYFEAQVWQRIVTLSLLSFSIIFLFGPFLLFMASFFVRSLIPTCGGIIVSIILSSLGQCSNNDDHHTFIFLTTQQLQLDT